MKKDFIRLCNFFSHFDKLWLPYVISTLIIASRNFIITVLNATISGNAVEMVGKGLFDWSILIQLLIWIVCFGLYDSVGVYFQTTVMHKISVSLRTKMFAYALGAKEEKLEKFGSRQELLSRMNYDIDGATGFLSYGILSPLMCCISGIGATVIVFHYSFTLCVLIYLVGAVAFVFQLMLAKIIRKKTDEIQKSKTRVFSLYMQTFQSSLPMRLTNLNKKVSEKFGERINQFKGTNIKKGKIDGLYGVVQGVFRLLCFFGVFCYCHLLSKMNLATTIYIIQITPLICTMILSVNDLFANLQRSMVNIDRVEELFEIPLEDESGADFAVDGEQIASSEKVICQYEDCKVNVADFAISGERGNIFAICGPSGCGKTTLLRLFLKLFDYEEGRLRLFGQEIKDCGLRSLRSAISYVPQENMVFPGTVRDNILYGNPNKSISDTHILELADKMGVKDVICSMGLDTSLNEGGTNLSGGQKQIIALVRSILYEKPILFLDEAFASIDERYTLNILSFLSQHNAYMFIVTHSKKIIEECNGTIYVGSGK